MSGAVGDPPCDRVVIIMGDEIVRDGRVPSSMRAHCTGLLPLPWNLIVSKSPYRPRRVTIGRSQSKKKGARSPRISVWWRAAHHRDEWHLIIDGSADHGSATLSSISFLCSIQSGVRAALAGPQPVRV